MAIKTYILHAARTLFLRHGLQSVSMDDVAAHLAVSKETLYKWYRQRDDLVLEVMEEHLEELRRDHRARAGQCPDALSELICSMDWSRQQRAGIQSGLFYDLQKYCPASWVRWQDYKNSYLMNESRPTCGTATPEGHLRLITNRLSAAA